MSSRPLVCPLVCSGGKWAGVRGRDAAGDGREPGRPPGDAARQHRTAARVTHSPAHAPTGRRATRQPKRSAREHRTTRGAAGPSARPHLLERLPALAAEAARGKMGTCRRPWGRSGGPTHSSMAAVHLRARQIHLCDSLHTRGTRVQRAAFSWHCSRKCLLAVLSLMFAAGGPGGSPTRCRHVTCLSASTSHPTRAGCDIGGMRHPRGPRLVAARAADALHGGVREWRLQAR